MVPVTVEFNGQTPILLAFHDQVDTKFANSDLRNDTVTLLYQTLEDIALEVRFTQIEQVLYLLYRYWHRVAEVFEHPGLQVPGVGEVFGLHRPKQIHTVAGS